MDFIDQTVYFSEEIFLLLQKCWAFFHLELDIFFPIKNFFARLNSCVYRGNSDKDHILVQGEKGPRSLVTTAFVNKFSVTTLS